MVDRVRKHPYFDGSYDTKERFVSYWHQINEIINSRPDTLLEIGIGNKFVTHYLEARRFNLISMDIDAALEPDVTGTVVEIPFNSSTFDTVSCCEVLEHLPYDSFTACLEEIGRVARKHVILSIPDVTTSYRIHLELPRFKTIHKMFQHPFPRPDEHIFDGEHYWEIGKKGYPLKKILSDIQSTGMATASTYRIYEFPYHRFFILNK